MFFGYSNEAIYWWNLVISTVYTRMIVNLQNITMLHTDTVVRICIAAIMTLTKNTCS